MACEICNGNNGGVNGNEQIVCGIVMCDYCHASHITLIALLHDIIKEYCRGPCGQSSSVLARRSLTERVIKHAIIEIELLRSKSTE